ncbi:MAG: hypothetical protein O4965_08285, partial [Trichodesmium sp. St19_bin1]|nr:hypothetical protein [Trichodesmium sp. St19_bin1]
IETINDNKLFHRNYHTGGLQGFREQGKTFIHLAFRAKQKNYSLLPSNSTNSFWAGLVLSQYFPNPGPD